MSFLFFGLLRHITPAQAPAPVSPSGDQLNGDPRPARQAQTKQHDDPQHDNATAQHNIAAARNGYRGRVQKNLPADFGTGCILGYTRDEQQKLY